MGKKTKYISSRRQSQKENSHIIKVSKGSQIRPQNQNPRQNQQQDGHACQMANNENSSMNISREGLIKNPQEKSFPLKEQGVGIMDSSDNCAQNLPPNSDSLMKPEEVCKLQDTEAKKSMINQVNEFRTLLESKSTFCLRKKETKTILNFLGQKPSTEESINMGFRFINVFGSCGSGKTLCVENCLGKASQKLHYLWLNGFTHSRNISSQTKSCCELIETEYQKLSREQKSDLNQIRAMKKLVVVIDEFDKIEEKETLIEFIQSTSNRLSFSIETKIILISNQVVSFSDSNFSSRKYNNSFATKIAPQTKNLFFDPYTVEQIVEIILGKLGNSQHMIERNTILYAAKKLSKTTCDLRSVIKLLLRAFTSSVRNRKAPGHNQESSIKFIIGRQQIDNIWIQTIKSQFHDYLKNLTSKQKKVLREVIKIQRLVTQEKRYIEKLIQEQNRIRAAQKSKASKKIAKSSPKKQARQGENERFRVQSRTHVSESRLRSIYRLSHCVDLQASRICPQLTVEILNGFQEMGVVRIKEQALPWKSKHTLSRGFLDRQVTLIIAQNCIERAFADDQ